MIAPPKYLIPLVLLILTVSVPAAARKAVVADVRVIHATTGKNHMDPGLRNLGAELKSVFRYTSYGLLQNRRLHLSHNRTGTVALPDQRTLEITPVSFSGDRIKFRFRIVKSGRQMFRTEVLLKNGRSITIGGPAYRGGVLLFNIFGSF